MSSWFSLQTAKLVAPVSAAMARASIDFPPHVAVLLSSTGHCLTSFGPPGFLWAHREATTWQSDLSALSAECPSAPERAEGCGAVASRKSLVTVAWSTVKCIKMHENEAA